MKESDPYPMSTLARLSFWVPAARMAEFEVEYETRLAPILKKHGLVESSEWGRKTAEGVFSRLFAMENPSAILARERAFHQDPAWQESLQCLGSSFETADPGGLLHYRFGVYRTPAGPGKATQAGPGFRQGRWQVFGVEDGLPSSMVGHMIQDREGNLWFATGGGACRYDGAEFKTFAMEDGLPDKGVIALMQDREGNLWFSTGEGVCRYDGIQFETFGIEDGLPRNIGGAILEDRQGGLWFGGAPVYGGVHYRTTGLCRYDGVEFKTFTQKEGLADDRVVCLLEDRQGCVWVGTEGGLCRYEGAMFTTFTTEDGLPDNTVVCLLEDREGTLWCGTSATGLGEKGGICRYNGRKFTPLPLPEGLAARAPQSMLEDREGALWIGTWLRGVWRYDGQNFQAFNTGNSLSHDWVHALLEDQEGNIWVGTHGGGLCRYDGQRIRTFTTADGLAHNTLHSAIVDRAGHLWLGTAGGGVSQYDGMQFKTLTAEEGLPSIWVRPILEGRKGDFWIGTHGGGLCRYDGKQFEIFTAADGLAGNAVGSLLEDRQGKMWVGTWEGLSRYDGQGFETFTPQDGLNVTLVRALVEDRQGRVWVGSGEGLSRYDGQGFKTFTTKDGLPANFVPALLEDRAGTLWIGTPGGLCRYDGTAFKTFTQGDGLPDDYVRCIFEVRGGHLWIGTFGGGVGLYDGLVFQSLSRQDGLISNTVNHICQHPDGSIWIATEAGLTWYRPSRTPPAVLLKDVVADQRYGSVAALQLPVSQRFVRFEFQGRSFTTRPDRMVYVCRLLGHEEAWKPCYSRQVEYQDLPLGEYTFQVRAVDRDLNYSEPASVRLKVIPDPRDARIDELEQRVRERTRELEEKNRALVVEMALERVRGQALGMQKHGDFLPVAVALFRELGTLGVRAWRSGFWIIDRDTGLTDVYTWGRWGEGQEEQQNIVRQVPLLGFRVEGEEWGKRTFAMWQSQQVFRFGGGGLGAFSKDRNQWVEYMRAHGRYEPDAPWPTKFSSAFGNFIPFSHGILTASTPELLTDEQVGVLQKFAGVLSLAYTRFLDLQAAEERARQQDRELAVEHVRNEALTMRSSDDLRKVVARILKEMVKLGVGTPGTNIGFVDEEADRLRLYLAIENPRKHKIAWSSPDLVELDSDTAVSASENSFSSFIFAISVASQGATDFRECWHEGKPSSFIQSPQGAEILEKVFVEGWGFDRCPPNWTGDWIITNVPFQYGFVGFRERQHSEEHIAIVRELTDALSLGYVRFLDFQRLEEQNHALEQANIQIQEANRHKSQFLSHMSHDLRTPMNAILGYTRILLRKGKDVLDERQYQNLQNIQLSADHLLALINDILDLSRVEAGRIEVKLEEVDLKKLVQECAAAVASLLKPGVHLKQETVALAPLHTDPDRLRRVLMNLLSNAVKFTEQGHITVSVQSADGWVELSVADTGVGIPAEDLPHIFEEFRQVEGQGRKREGTGLGLAIARKSVELLGGNISVESQVGKGTTFILKLTNYTQ